MKRNRELTLAARELLCKILEIALPCPNDMIGSLASLPLPDAADTEAPSSPLYDDPLQHKLRVDYRIEVPVIPWPAPPKRVLRISAQLYNSLPQYSLLAEAISGMLTKLPDKSQPTDY
jgi:isopenicillin-N epimerase